MEENIVKVNKGGRPGKYQPAFAKQVYGLALLGATDANLAAFFEVTVDCIDSWKRKHPAFVRSLKRGKQTADSKVAKSLYKRALGYEHNGKYYPPDTVAAIFWLKNRSRAGWTTGWTDRQEFGISRQLDQMSDEDFSKIVAQLAEHLKK